MSTHAHDPNLRSWVESANDPATDFPIQNLPLCVFEASHDGHSHDHLGVAIGDQILDVSTLNESAYFEEEAPELAELLTFPYWGGLMRFPDALAELRPLLRTFLNADTPSGGQQTRRLRQKSLRPIAQTKFALPAAIFNYTDFYASIHHAATVGSMFRPDNALLPNYKHVPIGYHARPSSLVVSGTDVRRPRGQQAPPDGEPGAGPSFGPCKMLDYELEVGCFVGPGNSLGEPIAIAAAEQHVFGLCLVNDWSARDIQKWEYQPLGPFLAKNFATTVSPFIVTLDALEPFRCPAYRRPAGDPRPLPYLFSETDQSRGGFDITLEVSLQSEQMRTRGLAPVLLSKSNAFREMYWTVSQMLTHHASNGCNLHPGDLLASGTVSGLGAGERGCLLELTWQGNGPDGKPLPRKPIQLPTGETHTFLADGDEVIMRGYCERDGFRRIGFGECRGRIVAAPTSA
jgi:fumarylacetoacetase